MPFSPIEEIIEDIRQGKMVIVCDDEDRENEGDLTIAAEFVTADDINFMATHARGLICLPMSPAMISRLQIPGMDRHNCSPMDTAFTVSIDALSGITTGISAADRARTVRVAVDDDAGPEDLVMPGHVFPLRARPGGVLQRPGQTEAAVDLSRLAGLKPAGVICEVMKEDGTMARVPDLEKFCEEHGIKMVTVAQIIEYRCAHDEHLCCTGETRLPTRFGTFRARTYEDEGSMHLALVMGHPDGREDVLVGIHSECLAGDVLLSTRCDCRSRLEDSMRRIQREGEGVIIYVRKRRQDDGLLDGMIEARHSHGNAPEDYRAGALILGDLGLERIRLMSNGHIRRLGLRGIQPKAEEVGPVTGFLS